MNSLTQRKPKTTCNYCPECGAPTELSESGSPYPDQNGEPVYGREITVCTNEDCENYTHEIEA